MRFNFKSLLFSAIILLPRLASAQQPLSADQMPAAWIYTEGFSVTDPADDPWWQSFNDPTLDSLISMAETNNYDLSMAVRRIEMARQGLRQAQAQYYPAFSASAGWSASRTSGMTTSHAMDATSMNFFNVGVDMNWEIDIFGKVKARADQSRASINVGIAQRDAMMVSVTSKVASAYLQLRMLQAQREVMQQHIAQQKKVTDITQARHEAGLASMLDVSQSLTTYYSTQANLLSIDTSIATTINSIAVLLGTYPDTITSWLSAPAPMPDYRQIVAVGVPMELLRRRPDIAQAEYTLAGYAAALGVAKKDFLPTLSLNGSIGTSAHDVGDIADKRSFTYSVAPTLSWTIFDGFARNAAQASAREQMMTGIDNYNATVLTAVQEVENALASYHNSLQYIDLIEKVTEEANRSYDLSIDLYKQGLTPFINVTNAQITYLQYSNELVSARGNALAALVSLYTALGGGWH